MLSSQLPPEILTQILAAPELEIALYPRLRPSAEAQYRLSAPYAYFTWRFLDRYSSHSSMLSAACVVSKNWHNTAQQLRNQLLVVLSTAQADRVVAYLASRPAAAHVIHQLFIAAQVKSSSIDSLVSSCDGLVNFVSWYASYLAKLPATCRVIALGQTGRIDDTAFEHISGLTTLYCGTPPSALIKLASNLRSLELHGAHTVGFDEMFEALAASGSRIERLTVQADTLGSVRLEGLKSKMISLRELTVRDVYTDRGFAHASSPRFFFKHAPDAVTHLAIELYAAEWLYELDQYADSEGWNSDGSFGYWHNMYREEGVDTETMWADMGRCVQELAQALKTVGPASLKTLTVTVPSEAVKPCSHKAGSCKKDRHAVPEIRRPIRTLRADCKTRGITLHTILSAL